MKSLCYNGYGLLDSNQKSEQISNLKADIENKSAEITELETTVSDLKTENKNTEVTEPEAAIDISTSEDKEKDGVVAVILGDKIDENEIRTVFKVGECTTDGPSTKCPITTDKGEALISYLTTDGALRLTLPNDQL